MLISAFGLVARKHLVAENSGGAGLLFLIQESTCGWIFLLSRKPGET